MDDDDVLCKLCDKIEAPLILVTNENNERNLNLNFGIIPICVDCAGIIDSYNNYQKEIINFVAIDYRNEYEYFAKMRENRMKYIYNFLKDIDKSDKLPLVENVTKLSIDYKINDYGIGTYVVSNPLGKTKTFKSIRWLTLFVYHELDKVI